MTDNEPRRPSLVELIAHKISKYRPSPPEDALEGKYLRWGSIIVTVLLSIALIVTTVRFRVRFDDTFWLSQLLKYLVVTAVQLAMGYLVERGLHIPLPRYPINIQRVKVNYTRKVVHISYFLWPQLLDYLFEKDANGDDEEEFKHALVLQLWNILIIILMIFLVTEPIRHRSRLIRMMFASIDRPEDQPYTMRWLSIQTIATLVVIAVFGVCYSVTDNTAWIFIPMIIVGLGDGLAEPVGIRFGRHKYKTRALFADRLYERSFEGSAVVLVMSYAALGLFHDTFETGQQVSLLVFLPVVMTITEALAPHSLDNPVLFGMAYGMILMSWWSVLGFCIVSTATIIAAMIYVYKTTGLTLVINWCKRFRGIECEPSAEERA